MNWFYSDGGAQKGPIDDAAFRALVANGTIRPDTLVWHEGMADWQPLSAAEPGLVPQVVPPPPPGAAGAPAAGAPIPPGTVPNHLVGAILSTIFCCLPFGIVSIVFAAQVNSKLATRDLDGARAASRSANAWMWVAIGVGIAKMAFALFYVLVATPEIHKALEEAAARGM